MIKINDYSSISFAQWVINRHSFSNLNNFNENEINELVEIYLKENAQKWNLRLFFKLFQDYLIRFDTQIYETSDLIFVFKDFCKNTRSLEFIDSNSIERKVYLYPLLHYFCNYANIRTAKQIDNKLKQIACISYKNRNGLLEWFNEGIKLFSEDLLYLFREYMHNLFSYDFDIFLEWIYKNKKGSYYFEPTNLDELSFDYRKYQLIEKIKNGIVDDNIQLRIERGIERHIPLQYITYIEEYNLLDFVNYLEKKSINIFKEVPKEILEGLAEEYVSQFPYASKKKIYNFIREIRDNKTLFSRFTDKFRKKYGNNFSLDRYISCKYHGVFLFRKNDNLSEFLRVFWPDIHAGTGNTIDFYFTDQDIKSDYHCKFWMEKYTNIEMNVKEFPSIFLWQIGSINKNHILLKGLSHKEIYEVIEYLTAQLENTSFKQSISETNIKVKQIIDNKKTINNIYIANNSQIGAFGEKASSNNNTFTK
ncbi:hypothetical protein [Clostridium sp. FP1]|uniref:hypothetical protein n=1 Tax=Clostridium sp. FP1 TaxID=2724076 RepID=UPI0013E93CD2|nr:hypothetical protein [Clostridium sp. FP1]MBZ9634654.1 hypothetical protein [Clostridium sp. FP1]